MQSNHSKERFLVVIVAVLVATAMMGPPAVASVEAESDSSKTISTATLAGESTATAAQTESQDQFEPNDDFGNATQLQPGNYTGLGITEGDVDIFAVQAESGSALSASIQFAQTEGDLDLFLIDPNQSQVLQASTTETDGENVSYAATETGTYYLAVAGYQGATAAYDLTVSVTGTGPVPSPPAGELEPNNDFGNATTVEPGNYSGLEITDNDVDVYAVNLSSGEALSAAIDFSQAEGDLDLFLVNPAEDEVLQTSASETDDENITHLATETGTHYLVVTGYQGSTASYNLSVSVTGDEPPSPPPTGEFEPNDDYDNATAVEAGTYTNRTITENDIDFYAVNLSEGDSLSASIQFAQVEGDLDLFLVNPGQNAILQTSTSDTDDENVSHVATETGTYYLVVVGYQGATAAYDLTVNATSGDGTAPTPPDGNGTTPNVGEAVPNDDFENATLLGPGTYNGLAITKNDIDFYGVNLTAGESLSASIEFAQVEGDLDLYLVSPDQNEILQASTSETDDENVSHLATETGTYYLVVTGYQSAIASYNLTISRSGAGDDPRPDPASDQLGWENGVWANETLAIDQSDGFSERERDRLLARSMARVEQIRGLEFRRNVSFSIISREEFGELLNQSAASRNQRARLTPYLNQVYEATFIVDEETDAYEEVVGESSATIGGFYMFGTDQFVLITEDPDRPTINEGVLIHELVHALQDQYSLASYSPRATEDEANARLGLSEGEANYVMTLFERRCEVDWECLPAPQADSDGGSDVNLGIAVTGFQPYSDGPVLVDRLFQQGGWDAVTQAYDDPPASTEQVIHPERYPDERPAALEFTSSPNGDWRLHETERIGEAWLYAMFWHQAREYGIPVVDPATFGQPDGGEFDTLNYTSAPSEGWGNDQLYMYTNGNQSGYVWQTVWDTETDAQQFQSAYQTVLQGQGGEQTGANRWVIPEGQPYADAFSVTRNGTTVTIVNGPTEQSLGAIAPTVVDGTVNQTSE